MEDPAPRLLSDKVPQLRTDLSIVLKPDSPGLYEVGRRGDARTFTMYDFEVSIARMLNGRRTVSQLIDAAAKIGIPVSLDSFQKFSRQLHAYGFLVEPAAPEQFAVDEATWTPRSEWKPEVRELFQSALRTYRKDRPTEARGYIEALLQIQPEVPEAIELLARVEERIAAGPAAPKMPEFEDLHGINDAPIASDALQAAAAAATMGEEVGANAGAASMPGGTSTGARVESLLGGDAAYGGAGLPGSAPLARGAVSARNVEVSSGRAPARDDAGASFGGAGIARNDSASGGAEPSDAFGGGAQTSGAKGGNFAADAGGSPSAWDGAASQEDRAGRATNVTSTSGAPSSDAFGGNPAGAPTGDAQSAWTASGIVALGSAGQAGGSGSFDGDPGGAGALQAGDPGAPIPGGEGESAGASSQFGLAPGVPVDAGQAHTTGEFASDELKAIRRSRLPLAIAAGVVLVAIIGVLAVPVRVSVSAAAELAPAQPAVDVKAPREGTIGKFLAQPGEWVEPDAVVAQFDDAEVKAQQARLQSELDGLDRQLQREQKRAATPAAKRASLALQKKQAEVDRMSASRAKLAAGSQNAKTKKALAALDKKLKKKSAELEKAKRAAEKVTGVAAVSALQDKIDAAKTKLGALRDVAEGAMVKATSAGIFAPAVRPGDAVKEGDVVARVEDSRSLRARIAVPPASAASLTPGQPVSLRFGEHGEHSLSATLTKVDANAGLWTAEATIENAKRLLPPRATGAAEVDCGRRPLVTRMFGGK